MRKKLTMLVAFGALVALAAPATAATEPSTLSPPLPGGKYLGKSAAGSGAPVVVKVPANNIGSALRGVVRFPCAGISARFRSDDGAFVARKRRRGKTIFKVQGSFRKMNVAGGAVVRLQRKLRHGACRPSRFKAVLRNAPAIHKSTVTYGPFPTMPSMGHHGGGGNVGRVDLEKPCEDCSLVGMIPELREADGSRANFDTGAMLHHVVFFNLNADDATCPNRPQRFFASGNERTPTLLPRGYGYNVSADDDWSLSTHLMNMSDQPKDLSIEVTFYYVKDASALEGVKPFWLDINNCRNSEYETPAGTHTEARDFTVSPEMAGNLVSIGGHLHDHGTRIDLENVASGERICRSRAGYGRDPSYEGHIESMSGCLGRVARLEAGDNLRILSSYEAPETLHDVMGIMVGYVAPSG